MRIIPAQSVSRKPRGFTLVELMITVAILSIIAAIAIPAYNGYIQEARLGTARANMDTLRLFLEDYRLDNDVYLAGGNTSPSLAQLNTIYGWTPDGDNGAFSYNITISNSSYDMVVSTGSVWVRCENRMATCCDSTTANANVSSCP